MRQPHLNNAFVEGAELFTEEGSLPLHVHGLGALRLPTGKIVACDPFVFPETKPFPIDVPVGNYSVKLSVADTPRNYQRVAYAMIQFSARPAVSWKMALFPDQDESTLGSDQFFGYGVDAGTGCFMDASVAEILADRMSSDSNWDESLIAEMDRTRVPGRAWGWLNTTIDPQSGGNLVAFSSGWGDGAYPCYWGYDSDGNIVSLTTDFCL